MATITPSVSPRENGDTQPAQWTPIQSPLRASPASGRATGGWWLCVFLTLSLALAGCATTPGASIRATSTPSGISSAPTVTSSVATAWPGATANPTLPAGAPTAGPGATAAPGAGWASLEARPLRFPTLASGGACPITPARQGVSPDYPYAQGVGPVYAIAANSTGSVTFYSASSLGDAASGYGGFKAFWEIQPAYSGPVLIRGARLGSAGALEFNGGLGQTNTSLTGMEPRLTELRIDNQNATPPAWSTWVTFTRLITPGCYAYQVDGASFEEIIVFQAVAS